MTIVITGANGFVGSAVVRRLLLAMRSVRPCVRAEKSFEDSTLPYVIVSDVSGTTDWLKALDGAEAVIHTAARVHVMNDTVGDPLMAFRRVNVDGTLNLARQAAAAGVKRLVYVSSIKVNGESTEIGRPFSADDTPAPEDFYGLSKYEAEIGLRRLSKDVGIEVVIVRPPLVYGPGVRANFATMVGLLKRGLPLPLGAVTQNRRSLVALDNLVDLLVACVDHPNAAGQTFLVSDGEDLSTSDLLRRMGNALGKPARLLPVPPALLQRGADLLRKDHVAKRLLGTLQVDIAKTLALLDWVPPITVDEGLRRAAASFF